MTTTPLRIEKTRILVLDCNRFELATLADSLRMQGLDIVGQISDTEGALAVFRAIHPDAIVINFQGCNHQCAELLQSFRELDPQLGILPIHQIFVSTAFIRINSLAVHSSLKNLHSPNSAISATRLRYLSRKVRALPGLPMIGIHRLIHSPIFKSKPCASSLSD